MDDEMISKKELLEKTGISYGQLYRWKRKGLLPEEWFVKKSAFTGQETFFPAAKVLERIAKIRELKEETSLDDLAGRLSDFADRPVPEPAELVTRNIASEKTLVWIEATDLWAEFPGIPGLVLLTVLDRLYGSGLANDSEAQTVLELLSSHHELLMKPGSGLIFGRVGAQPVFAVVENPAGAVCSSGVNVLARISFGDVAEELKVKLA